MYGDEYAKIGTDNLPPGHSFDIAERARQDAALAAILNLPEHEGPCGASINVREIREAIKKLKYGKASGVDCRADVTWSWGTSYPGRSKIDCIDTLLLFRGSGWAS